MSTTLLAVSGLLLAIWSNWASAQTLEGTPAFWRAKHPGIQTVRHGKDANPRAKAGTLIYVVDQNGNLDTVDVSNLKATVIGNTGQPLTDIAFAPDGTLYGISFSSLYKINTASGAASFVAAITGGTRLNSLFIRGNGIGYAESPNKSDLYELDLNTGGETLVGYSNGYLSAGDITFYSGKNLLMSTSDVHNDIVQIDPNTGAASNPVALPVSSMYGLASPASGKLYGFSGSLLYQLDLSAKLVQDRATLLADLSKQGVGFVAGAAYAGNFGTSYSYQQLYAFKGGSDGSFPLAGLYVDGSGNLYGTTNQGGSADSGTVFELASDGTETVLYSFCSQANCVDGGEPLGSVTADGSGNFYGTTFSGGSNYGGTIFKLAPDGTESVLYPFCSVGANCTDGAEPWAGLIFDASGNLYGTTGSAGDASCGCGTVFELSSGGVFSVLHSFGGTDGSNPQSNLIFDAAGNLYGTTVFGGDVGDDCGLRAGGCGTVFELAPNGTVTTLYNFTGGTGSYPRGGLVLDSKSNLYGTTYLGGSAGNCNSGNAGCGIVFKLSPSSTETILYPFNGGTDGAGPVAGLIPDAQGNLYGTTVSGGGSGCGGGGCGMVFEIAPDTAETILYAFQGGKDGAFPWAGLAMDSKGNLYGTTQSGGGKGCGGGGCGTIFELARTKKGTFDLVSHDDHGR